MGEIMNTLSYQSRVTAKRRKHIERDGWEVLIDDAVIQGVSFNSREDAIAYGVRVLAYYELSL